MLETEIKKLTAAVEAHLQWPKRQLKRQLK